MKVESREFAAGPGVWRLHSAKPDATLIGVVEEVWEVEGQLMPFAERVLPNGFLEVMINLGPAHRLITARGAETFDRAWVSGVQERALSIESPNGTHLLSARLRAAHARRVIGPAIRRTGNAVIDLESVIGHEAGDLRAAIIAETTVEARMERLADFIRARFAVQPRTDAYFEQAVQEIEQSHGRVRIDKIALRSRKHLGTLFMGHLGVSPKTFARIVRFAWVLRRIQESESVDWSELAHEAGYSDQSHLVREFQQIAATSPTSFLRSRTPDGAALWVDPG